MVSACGPAPAGGGPTSGSLRVLFVPNPSLHPLCSLLWAHPRAVSTTSGGSHAHTHIYIYIYIYVYIVVYADLLMFLSLFSLIFSFFRFAYKSITATRYTYITVSGATALVEEKEREAQRFNPSSSGIPTPCDRHIAAVPPYARFDLPVNITGLSLPIPARRVSYMLPTASLGMPATGQRPLVI